MKQNLFAEIPAELPEELVTLLSASSRVRIERIVSRGHSTPPGFWYDQADDEFVLLLQGRARLEYADGEGPGELSPGDCLTIPAGVRHRVAWTEPGHDTVWLTVHVPRHHGTEE